MIRYPAWVTARMIEALLSSESITRSSTAARGNGERIESPTAATLPSLPVNVDSRDPFRPKQNRAQRRAARFRR